MRAFIPVFNKKTKLYSFEIHQDAWNWRLSFKYHNGKKRWNAITFHNTLDSLMEKLFDNLLKANVTETKTMGQLKEAVEDTYGGLEIMCTRLYMRAVRAFETEVEDDKRIKIKGVRNG